MRVPFTHADVPPWHEIDEYKFQDFCRELFSEQEGVATADLFGNRGQGQYGVDLKIEFADSPSIQVAQIKRYAKFTARDVTKACDEFLSHKKFWTGERAKRFFLVVACSLADVKVRKELLRQKKILQRAGFKFESWDAHNLLDKTRSNRDIAQRYLLPHWVENVCGRAQASSVAVAQKTQLSSAQRIGGGPPEFSQAGLSKLLLAQINTIRKTWKAGSPSKALKEIQKLTNDKKLWPSLPGKSKAAALTLEAGITADVTGDLTRVKSLLSQSRAYYPKVEQSRILAIVELHGRRPQAAIKILERSTNAADQALKGGALLQLGKVAEAISDLTTTIKKKKNSDALRFRAIAHLLNGNRDAAKADIRAALSLDPYSYSNQLTLGQILYASAVSATTLRPIFEEWPLPVDWDLIRRDAGSLKGLREAQDLFRRLHSDTAIDAKNRCTSAVWLLAAQANDPERQNEAETLARSLLTQDPGEYRAFIWAMARRYKAPTRTIISNLQSRIKNHSASLGQIITLLQWYYVNRDSDQLAIWLENGRSTVRKEGGTDTLVLWKSKLHALTFKGSDVSKLLRGLQTIGVSKELSVSIASEHANSIEAAAALASYIVKNSVAAKNPTALLIAFQLAARAGEWQLIAPHASKLVSEIATGEALRVATYALFNTGQYAECISLVENNVTLFEQARVPLYLKKIIAASRSNLGQLPRAIKDAEEVLTEEPTKENLFRLFEARVQVGDLEQACVIAKLIAARRDLEVPEALSLSALVAGHDDDLAKNLWRYAANLQIPDAAIPKIVELAFKLGMEAEATKFIRKMPSLARRKDSGIQAVNLEILRQFASQHAKKMHVVESKYGAGEVPVHVLSGDFGVSLGRMYVWNPQFAAGLRTPNNAPRLLARHGSRQATDEPIDASPSTIPLSRLRLFIDSTAAMLAEELGLLETVLNSFENINIPAELQPTLTECIRELAPAQPARIEAARRILDAEHRGHVALTARSGKDDLNQNESNSDGIDIALQHATKERGFAVALSTYKKRAATLGAVVKNLQVNGPLSGAQARKCFSQLGSEKIIGTVQIPGQQVPLAFFDDAIRLIALTEAFSPMCKRFKVRMTPQLLDQFKNEVADHDARKQAIETLESARKRIKDAVLAEKIKVLTPYRLPANKSASLAPMSLALRGASKLISMGGSRGDVLWIDDRFFTKHQTANGSYIASFTEILDLLLHFKKISPAAYYQFLLRAREANIRFIPITAGELIFHLQNTQLNADAAVETSALETIRRYFNACLYRADELQTPVLKDNEVKERGETDFVIQSVRAFQRAIQALWSQRSTRTAQEAKSSWILNSLHVDISSSRYLMRMQKAEEDFTEMRAVNVSALVIVAIHLPATGPRGRSPRSEYLAWLWNNVLSDIAMREPKILPIVAQRIIQSLIDSAASKKSEVRLYREATRRLITSLYSALPEGFRKVFQKNESFRNVAGERLTPFITLMSHRLNANVFWKCAEAAWAGKPARLKAEDGGPKIELQADRKTNVIHMKIGRDKKWITVADFPWGLLSRSKRVRREWLQQRKSLAWGNLQSQTQRIARILQEPDVRGRLDALEEAERKSLPYFYSKLAAQLIQRTSFRMSDFMPEETGAFREFLRYGCTSKPGESYRDALERAVLTAFRERGPAYIFDAFGGMPLQPSPKLENVLRQSVKRLMRARSRRQKRFRFEKSWGPIHAAHLARFATTAHTSRGSTIANRLARRKVSTVFVNERNNSIAYMAALQSVARWVFGEWSKHEEPSGWPVEERFAATWFHSVQLLSVFRRSGAGLEWIEKLFRENTNASVEDLFGRAKTGWRDAAHPRNVDPVGLLRNALFYSVTEPLASAVNEVEGEKLLTCFKNETGSATDYDTQIFRDSSLYENRLSFFNSKFPAISKRSPFGKVLGRVDPRAWSKAIMNALKEIQAGKEQAFNWLVVHACLGSAAAPQRLASAMSKALLATDFVKLAKSDEEVGTISVLFTSAMQIVRKSADCAQHLEGAIRILFSEFLGRYAHRDTSAADNGKKLSSDMSVLLDAYLNICLREASDEKAAEKLASFLDSMLAPVGEVPTPLVNVVRILALGLAGNLGSKFAKPYVLTRSVR